MCLCVQAQKGCTKLTLSLGIKMDEGQLVKVSEGQKKLRPSSDFAGYSIQRTCQ